MGSAVVFFSSRVVRRSFHLRCSGVKESSLRAGKLIGEAGFKKKSLLLSSLRLDPLAFRCDQRSDAGYRCRIVDAIVKRVLPREVAQAVKGSNDTQFYGVVSGEVGKELPRNKSVVCVLLMGERSQGTTGNVSRMHVCSGDIP